MNVSTMKAAVYKGIGTLNFEQVPIPRITRSDEVLIRVHECSICGTDVHMLKVPPTYEAVPNTILGHEIVGVVVEIGSGVRFIKVGNRVVVNPNENCGVCACCRKGLINHCLYNRSMGITVNGGFAEYVKTSEKQVFVISDHLSDNHAVFAEPLSCALNGYSRIGVSLLSKVVIFGCGPIGLLFAMLVQKDGAHVIMVEPNKYRRDVCMAMGFKVVDPFNENVEDFVLSEFGSLADYAIDAAGSQLPTAIKICDFRGTILIFGVNNSITPTICLGEIQQKEITVIGSFIALNSMPFAIKILESNILDIDPLITHILPIEKLQRGIELMTSGEGMKIIIAI